MPKRHNLFNRISDAIVLEIVRYLEIDNFLLPGTTPLNRSLLNLSLVEKRLRRVCIGPLYKTVHVTISRRLDGLLRTIIEAPTYSNLVKELSLGWPDEDEEAKQSIKELDAKIRKLQSDLDALQKKQDYEDDGYCAYGKRRYQLTDWEICDGGSDVEYDDDYGYYSYKKRHYGHKKCNYPFNDHEICAYDEQEDSPTETFSEASFQNTPPDPTVFVDLAKDHRLPQGLIDKLSSGVTWANALLLPHLLPRLEALSINSGERVGHSYGALLSTMIQNGQMPLNLRSITGDFNRGIPYTAQEAYRLEVLLPFFIHPSVTEIRAYRTGTAMLSAFADEWLPKGNTLQSWSGKSNVESLELYGSCDLFLNKYLLLPRSLKRFIYAHQNVSHDSIINFQLDNLFGMIFLRANETLEMIKIKWDILYDMRTAIVLPAFESLRKLFIHYDFLLGPDPATASPISTLLPINLEVFGMYDSCQSRTRWTRKSRS
jgi:hypothetical protein